MANKSSIQKITDTEQVTEWMLNSIYPLKPEIEKLRTIIKNSDKRISERIKWNAPSYYYMEDIVTFGPDRKGRILLVFHHPYVVKIKSDLLEGNYKDRRLAYFSDSKEVQLGKKELERIIKEIVNTIAKKVNNVDFRIE
ncbi:DUF1801 domain-containing protein [Aurantibacillus circumpalustris]|uniref:DUF1801 domain-containing protein n=1 Tax=Aurantibacillus circumpalustris TaxID=3036359 RepID=UPI00295A5FF8|nr:DUF1801 domain-containing protein [Aurantibacillus circumpalustris]